MGEVKQRQTPSIQPQSPMADRKATNYGDPILAKALRRNMTTSEIILWQELRNRSLGLKFRRQHPIGPYVLDFFCHKLKLCIELDGDVHQSTEANMYDERRTAFLNSQGITVLRYSNEVVSNNIGGILESIKHYALNPVFLPGWHINEYI